MLLSRISFLLFSAVLILSVLSSSLYAEEIPSLSSFYSNLFSGEYRSAIDNASVQAAGASDPLHAATAVFRIEESVRYAETAPYAKETLARCIREGKKCFQNEEVQAIAESVLISLSVRSGDISLAGQMRARTGRRTTLVLHGPFPVHGDEDLKDIGAMAATPSYPVDPDEEGVFRFHVLSDNTRNSAYLAEDEVFMAEDGEIRLTAGSSGNMDIYADGNLILSERGSKCFFPVQKAFILSLSKGKHRIVSVVSGNDKNEASFCLSIKGNSVVPLHGEDGNVLSCTPVPSLCDTGTDAFSEGYFLYKSGYYSQDSAGTAFDAIRNPESFEWALSRYYRALTADKDEIKDSLLRSAAEGGVSRAYAELCRLALSQGRLIHGSEYLDLFAKAEPHSPELNECRAQRSLASLWFEDALEWCASLERCGYTAAASSLAASVYEKEGYQREQYAALLKAYAAEKNNQDISFRLCSSAALSADSSVLDRVAADHPWNIGAAVMRAEKVFAMKGAGKAIPYVSSLLRRSPSNGRVLFLAGLCYRKLGDSALAKDYIGRAAASDSEKAEYRETYDILFGEKRNIHPDDPEQWEKETRQYQNEPAVCISSDTAVSLYDDGSSLSRVREVYRVFSRERARDLLERSVAVNRNTDELLELRLRALSHGVVIQGDDIRTQDLSDPESRIYVDLTEYSIKAPDVSPGGFLIFEYSLRSSAGRSFRGFFSDEKFFDTSFRILHASVSVTGSKPFNVKSYRCKAVSRVFRDSFGRTVTSLSIGHIPPVREEQGMALFADRLPAVGISSFGTWDDFYNWYYSQMRNRSVVSASMKKDLDALCSGSSGPEETAERIYTFVTSRIRYVGDEAGLGGYIPRPCNEVYEGRAGDCKDIALLLAVLLREKGISADLALLRTSDAGTADMSFPSLYSFNHAVCRVAFPSPFFLDGTVKNYSLYDLPLNDRDVDALVIGSRKAFIERIAGGRYSFPREESETRVTLSSDLSAHLKRKLIKRGTLAAEEKDNRADRVKIISRYWTKLYPGAEVSNPVKKKEKGTAMTSYDVSIPGFARKSADEAFIPAALIPFSLETSFGKSVRRENDVYIGEYREFVSSVMYCLPAGMEIRSLPKNSSFSYRGMTLSYSFVLRNKRECTVTARLSVKRDLIRKEDYPQLRNFLSDCALAESRPIIVSAGAAE